MTIKLHLFSGFADPRFGITVDTELGHIYSDTGDEFELIAAERQLHLKPQWMQCKALTGLLHFDIWGEKLRVAKELFKIVDNEELAADMAKQMA